MLFSQFIVAAVSTFVTPFTIMAVALLVEWYHSLLDQESLNSKEA